MGGLRPDKAALKVRMNLACGLRRLCAAANGPGAHLRLACRQERDEAQQRIGLPDQPLKAAALQPQPLLKFPALVRLKGGQLRFDLGADGHDGRSLLIGLLLDGKVIFIGQITVGQQRLGNVGGKDDRLGRQQRHRGQKLAHALAARLKGARRAAGLQVAVAALQQLTLALALGIALHSLGRAVDAALDQLDV